MNAKLFPSIAMSVLLLCFAHTAFPYGNLQFKDDHANTVNSLWDERSYNSATFPDGVPWLLNDQGTAGAIAITTAELQAIVNTAFETWEAVPESKLAFTFGGITSSTDTGDGHGLPPSPALDGDNVILFGDTPAGALGITYIFTLSDEFTFDATNSDFGGGDANPDIPSGTYPAGTILDVDIMLDQDYADWSVSGEYDKIDLQGVLVHEMGHFIGLCHSCVRELPSSRATMFPLMITNPVGLHFRSLAADDIAGVAAYYPSASFSTNFGSISGTVVKDGTSRLGVHVWAVQSAHREIIIGTYSDENGDYTLQGLPPGDYLLREEPLCFDHARINEILLGAGNAVFTDFQAGIWNGVVAEASATLISVSAGAEAGPYDLVLVDASVPDAYEPDSARPQATRLRSDGSHQVHSLPHGDRDYYELSLEAGKTYKILTSNIVLEFVDGATVLNSDTLVRLFDADNNLLMQNNDIDIDNALWNSLIVFPTQQTGTYYLEVVDFSETFGEEGCSNYDISLEEYEPSLHYVDAAGGSDLLGDGSPSSPWATIQHAIDSVTGSVENLHWVRIAEGTYAENVTCHGYVSLFGGFDPASWNREVALYPTVIDGQQLDSTVKTANCHELNGLTVTNGRIQNNAGGDPAGGGISCDRSSVMIRDCRIEGNFAAGAAGSGAGLGILNLSESFVADSIIENNQASYNGGGILCHDSFGTFVRNVVRRNQASYLGGGVDVSIGSYATTSAFLYSQVIGNDAFNGGGFFISGTDDTFFGNSIISNSASNQGGGIFITYSVSTYCEPSIQKNIIASNSAGTHGGGIGNGLDNGFWRSGRATISENMICGNSCGSSGGGLSVADCYYFDDIFNNVFLGNRAERGGGMSFYFDDMSGVVAGNAIAMNESTSGIGGGVHLNFTSYRDLRFYNNIIYGNLGTGIFEESGAADGHLGNNNFYGNSAGAYYDQDTDTTYATADGINLSASNPGRLVAGNVDWEPGFVSAASGTADAIVYDASSDESILTDNTAPFAAGALAGLTINPATSQQLHFYIISNTTDTITTWGDMVSAATPPCTYQVFDYHLAQDSLNIDAGMDVSAYVTTDIDGEPRPMGTAFDIGADEYATPTPAATVTPTATPFSSVGDWRRY